MGKGDGTFQGITAHATGNDPISLLVEDLNRDGTPDLAVANYGAKTLSVLLGNSDGTFQRHVDYTTGSNPISLVGGDFNGDGKPDLAVANNGNNTISVLLGTGDGTLQAHVDYATGRAPNSVAAGDFDRDGKLDLAVTNRNDNTVSVLLGKGDGTFERRADYMTGSSPISVSVGDFNGDGRPDLAVTNRNDNTVSVLLGNGDGTFQAHVANATGLNPWSVAVGDLNGDGKQDLAVTTYYRNYYDTVSVLLGNGDGTFGSHEDYPVTDAPAIGSTPGSVAMGDFDGDGKTDLAVANDYPRSVSVLFGNGDGTFQSSMEYARGKVYSTTVADLNRDGAPDLTVITGGANLAVLMNIRGTFEELHSSANPSIVGQPVTVTAAVNASLSSIGLDAPTGTIRFVDGTQELGTQTLGGNGVATLNVDALTAGAHTITALYTGDTNFNRNSSEISLQVIGPDFELDASPSKATLKSGNSTEFTVAVSAENGFDGAVSLSCSVSPTPAFAPMCALSPNSVTLAKGGSAIAKLAISTIGTAAGQQAASFGQRSRLFYERWLPISGLAALGIGIATGGSWKKKKIMFGILFVSFLASLATQTACGGGEGSDGSSVTPPGQYIIRVSALSGSVAHATEVTLTVD